MNTAALITLLAEEVPGRILGFDHQMLWDLFLQLWNTAIIVVVLYFVLHKPVSEFLEKRKAHIAGELKDAATAKEQGIQLKKDYEDKLANINKEESQILSDARALAVEKEQKILDEARKEADQIREKAKSDIALEQERVKDDMKNELIEVSTLMAGKFVSGNLDKDKQNEIIDDIIKEMGDVNWLN